MVERQPFRLESSASTASRMNSDRLPGPASLSIRAKTSGDKRIAVNFTPSDGRPMRAALSVTQISFNPRIRLLTYPLYTTYKRYTEREQVT